MNRRTAVVLPLWAIGCSLAMVAGACSTAPRSDAGRMALTAQSRGTVDTFLAHDPSIRDVLDRSVGFAVFPDVGKAGFIGGGAYGRGEVYQNGQLVGYADLTQGSIGLQAGAQSYDEMVIFLTPDQLDRFRNNQFAFSANVSAVALQAGAAAAADHSKGVVVIVQPRGGLMAEASIGGQEFSFKPASEVEYNNDRGYASGHE